MSNLLNIKNDKDESNLNNSFFITDDDDSECVSEYISECDKFLETVDDISDEEDSDNESIVSILPILH